MGRYWRIFRSFFVSGLARELEFRANFLAKVLHNATWFFFFLMMLLVVYRNTDQVAGWDRGEAYVLAATSYVMHAITNALFPALQEVPQHVRQGTLDFIITKPLDTQFWVSFRRFNFSQVGALIAGLVMLIAGVVITDIHPGLADLSGYTVLLVAAVVLFYSMNLALMSLSIYFVRVENLWVLGEMVMETARYPVEIYGARLARILTYYLPIALLATIPARQLVDGFQASFVGLGLLWAAVVMVLARKFWLFGLAHYSSASS